MRKRPSPMHGSRQIHPLGEDPALQSLTPRSLARNVAELEALRERVQELEQTLSRHEIAAVDVVSTAPARKLPPLVPDSIGTSEDGTIPGNTGTPLLLMGVKSLGELPLQAHTINADRTPTAPELSLRRGGRPTTSPQRACRPVATTEGSSFSSCDGKQLGDVGAATDTEDLPTLPAVEISAASVVTTSQPSPSRVQTKISLDPAGVATVAVSQRGRLYQILKRVSTLVPIEEDELVLLKKLVDAEIGDVIRFLVEVETETDAGVVRDKLSLLRRHGSPSKLHSSLTTEPLTRVHPIWGIQYPLQKIARNLEALQRGLATPPSPSHPSSAQPTPASSSPSLSPDGRMDVVVLVSSGAYNPVHMLHVRAFYVARQFVEANYRFPVVGAFLSPSHDTFVRTKNRRSPREMIPRRHRLALAEAAVASSSWLEVDKWEITRRRVLDYLSTLAHVREMCDAHFPTFRFQLMYVCGPNTVVKLSHAALRDEQFGCIVVCRPTQRDMVVKQLGKTRAKATAIVEDTGVLPCDLERATSVRVRRALEDIDKNAAALGLMVGQPALHYLRVHGISGKVAGREAWTEDDKAWRSEDLPFVEYNESG